MWLISRALVWRLRSMRAGRLRLLLCTINRKRLASQPLSGNGPLMEHYQTLAEIATWPKLAVPEDVEPYLEQNIKDGADYIKLSQSSTLAVDALSHLHSA